jgi:hypothetical protein
MVLHFVSRPDGNQAEQPAHLFSYRQALSRQDDSRMVHAFAQPSCVQTIEVALLKE